MHSTLACFDSPSPITSRSCLLLLLLVYRSGPARSIPFRPLCLFVTCFCQNWLYSLLTCGYGFPCCFNSFCFCTSFHLLLLLPLLLRKHFKNVHSKLMKSLKKRREANGRRRRSSVLSVQDNVMTHTHTYAHIDMCYACCHTLSSARTHSLDFCFAARLRICAH